eukprot:3227915-Amphidinium_carterae.1
MGSIVLTGHISERSGFGNDTHIVQIVLRLVRCDFICDGLQSECAQHFAGALFGVHPPAR